MELYLVRHGLAGQHGDYVDDTQRPLTEEGRRKTRSIAQGLHQLGLRFDLLLTSPLVRARQTAEILQSEGLSKTLEQSDHLAPDGKLENWLDWLAKGGFVGDRSLALVGHEPNLSSWAEMLVWGESRGAIVLKKAGIIGLRLTQAGSPLGKSELFWLTPPKLFLRE